ncbi:MAG: histidine--tRNA ligase [Candidatus Thermoplasmatota archaeon]
MIERARGTRDFVFEEMERRRNVENLLRNVCERWGYREIATPTFENSLLFKLKSGESIVEEMYVFKDKGGREIALRPELTAPAFRLYVSELQNRPKPLKIYYFGNCFRYEEPQSGRYREFWHFGVELLGTKEVEGEGEIIALANELVNTVGIKNYKLRLGNISILRKVIRKIGIKDEKKVLQLIDKGKKNEIKEIFKKENLEPEPLLTILDTKGDIDVLDRMERYGYVKEEVKRLKDIIHNIELQGMKNYTIDLGIARGLTYYTGMVFEIDAEVLGAEKQICGGGTYSLSEIFNIPQLPSTGFAIGFDRLLITLEREGMQLEEKGIDAYVIPVSRNEVENAIELVSFLRRNGVKADVDLMKRNLDKNLKHANSIGAKNAILVGENELKSGAVTVRNMTTGKQSSVRLLDLPAEMREGK